MASVIYVSQFQDSHGLWRRRLSNGEIADGSQKTPYPNLEKEKPGKGNG